MHDRRAAARDVQDFEIAAEVVAVWYERGTRRNGDTHVAEGAAFDDGIVVGADEESDVDGIGERDTGQLLRGEGVAEPRHRHDIDAVPPLELDHRVGVRQAVPRLGLFRGPADRAAVLERHQAVAVQRRGHVDAARFQGGANGPADLPVLLDAGADEARAGREHEVAAHALPDKMEVVPCLPHVLAGAADHILLPLRIVRRGAGVPHATNVGLPGEDADGTLRLGNRGEGQEDRDTHQRTNHREAG